MVTLLTAVSCAADETTSKDLEGNEQSDLSTKSVELSVAAIETSSNTIVQN